MAFLNKYKDKLSIQSENGKRVGFVFEDNSIFESGLFDEKNRIKKWTKKHKQKNKLIEINFFYYKDFETMANNNIFANILESSVRYNFAVENADGKLKLIFNISEHKLKKIKKLI